MKYRYLTFDCYGTLVDWRTGIERELRSTLGPIRTNGRRLMDAYLEAERREEKAYKKYREVLANSAAALSGVLGRKVSSESAARFASSVPRWRAFPDSAPFLREMGARGYRRYILSNVDNDLLSATVENDGFEVDGFVTAEEVGSYKPDLGHWLEFLKRTGAAKGEVLHVAQSIYHDVLPMQRFGIGTAWVNRYGERLPTEAAPTMIADGLERLSAALP